MGIQRFPEIENNSSGSTGGLQGTWDASTNTPTLANTDTGKTGVMYQVSVGGTVDFGAGNITFEAKDIVVNNGVIWDKIDATDAVHSVNGNTGAVNLGKNDLGLGNVNNTSDADKPISSATQSALNNKANSSHTHTESDITDLDKYTQSETDNLLSAKVDVDGSKVLSDNNFTTTEKSKLSNIEANATANPNAFDKVTDDLDDISEGTTNKAFTSTLKNKLDNIEANAEVNPSDAEIKTSVDNELTGSVVGTTDTQTLTNKTIDADNNTITDIANANIKSSAGIDATKIADGSISNTEFQYLNGVTSNIQNQIDGLGGKLTYEMNYDGIDTNTTTTYSDLDTVDIATGKRYVVIAYGYHDTNGTKAFANTECRLSFSGHTGTVSTTGGGVFETYNTGTYLDGQKGTPDASGSSVFYLAQTFNVNISAGSGRFKAMGVIDTTSATGTCNVTFQHAVSSAGTLTSRTGNTSIIIIEV